MKVLQAKSIMIASLIAADLGIIGPVRADDTPPPPKSYTLTLTEPEILYIADTLKARPYNDVAALLSKIQTQINDQNKPVDAPKPSDEPTSK